MDIVIHQEKGAMLTGANMHVGKKSMSTCFGDMSTCIQDMLTWHQTHVNMNGILTCMVCHVDMCLCARWHAFWCMSTSDKGMLYKSWHVDWSLWMSRVDPCIRLPVLFISRNSHRCLSRRISSPSSYPRACCPTSYTTYAIYTEGCPCRPPPSSRLKKSLGGRIFSANPVQALRAYAWIHRASKQCSRS